MMLRPGAGLLLLYCLLFIAPAQALETDQFYAWGKPIADSTELLNAWVIIQVQDTLDRKSAGKSLSCEQAVNEVQKSLQHSIYMPIEMWIVSSSLVDQVPRGVEQTLDYREHYLLSRTFPLDIARWLQPSPTIQVGDVRLGTDKLAHFFSEGWWYYKRWRKSRDQLQDEELQQQLLDYGVRLEWWAQGLLLTGILSPADMEANYQGFLFYQRLCHGEHALLQVREGHWQFSDSFDFRDYVSPEWDESWNPNVYGRARWKGIRSTMKTYCPMLHSDWVQSQRASYAQGDTTTPVEKQLHRWVEQGDLPDPSEFDIEAVCSSEPDSMAPGHSP